MPVNQANQWEPFRIFGANGQEYTGVQPSLIPKPFRSVVVTLGGMAFKPSLPRGCSGNQVFGYDAAVRMGVNMSGSGVALSSDQAYRLITLLKDGRRWSKLVYVDGRIEEYWMR